MALTLMYITNDPDVAKIAETSGVDWIFLDLEVIGKQERQGHLDTVISHHNISDVTPLRRTLTTSQLLVRVNPIFEGSRNEIGSAVDCGANIVMLPFFKKATEVESFVNFVGGKTKTCLLLETPEAVENLDCILAVEGIDFIHIGLNDLHLGYGLKFMFELLANGVVEAICEKISKTGIPYGFGGIAGIGQGTLPAEYIIAEHYRLGSSLAILSRSFCDVKKINDLGIIRQSFKQGVQKIRAYEQFLKSQNESFFRANTGCVRKSVDKIMREINSGRYGS